MISKQLLLGIGLVVGGGILAAALNSNDDTTAKQGVDGDVAHPKVEPLKQDIQTERHLSEQKKKERENNTLAQEQEAKQFVEEQERAKQQLALAGNTANTPANSTANSTTNAINASVNSVVSEVSAILPDQTPTPAPTSATTTDELTVQVRPEAIAATKKAEENKRKQQARAKQQRINATKSGQHIIARGDSLSKLSQQYNVPISTIMSANNMTDRDALIAGDILIIPGKSTTKPKKASSNTNVTAQAKKDKKSAQSGESKSAKSVKPFYSVQVSLADSEAKANELAKQYRQAGYKVQTSKTSRGVRVLVGSTSSATEANKLKAKLSKDSRVNAGDAWVKRVDTINP